MSNFIGHSACPKCGSKNNVMDYDTFSKCMTPGCDYRVQHKETTMVVNNNQITYVRGNVPNILIEERKLVTSTVEAYNVTERKIGNHKVVSFPYYASGHKIVAVKNRIVESYGESVWSEKKYNFEGQPSLCPVFGLQLLSNRKKGVIITEGELDCLAAYQMYGLKYNVISIGTGAASAKSNLIKIMNKLKAFEVIICFDNDEPGQIAAEECMQLFPKGSVRNVAIPQPYKDACDMLMADEEALFRQVVNQASVDNPDCLIDKEDLVQSTIDYIYDTDKSEQGFSSGFSDFDEVSGGLRGGEVITLVAGTGVGKSSFSFNLAYNAAVEAQQPILFIPLEMLYKTVMTRLIEIDLATPLIVANQTQNANIDLTPKDKVRHSAEKISEYLHVYNHTGFMKVENLISDMEFYCRAYGIRFIILDHVHAAVNSGTDGNDYKIIDFLIAELKRVALQHNTCILAISHMSRSQNDTSDNKPTLNKIRGSHGIAQNSDLVIGMSRPRDTTQALFETLKPHRLFGIYKTFIMAYNRDTMRYSPSGVDNAEILEEGYTFEEEKQESHIPVQEPVRVQHSDGESQDESPIRTTEAPLREDVCTGLPSCNTHGEADTDRSEGISDGSRPDEDETSTESPPQPRHTVSSDESESETKFEVKAILDLL